MKRSRAPIRSESAAYGDRVNLRLKLPSRAMATALFVLTGGLSVVLPLLDAREPLEAPGIEAQHDASRCSYFHDHNLCVVFHNTPAATPPGAALKPLAATLRAPNPPAPSTGNSARRSTASARAPPILL